MASSEAAEISPIVDLHVYLETCIQEFDSYLKSQTINHKVDWQALNNFFLAELGME